MIFPQGCKPDRIPWSRFNDKLSRQSFREKRRPVIPDQTQGRNCMDHAEYMQEKCRILSGGNGRRSLYVE